MRKMGDRGWTRSCSLLVGHLYGILSERRLEEEITLNIAYRWVLGLELDQRVPDHPYARTVGTALPERQFSATFSTAL